MTRRLAGLVVVAVTLSALAPTVAMAQNPLSPSLPVVPTPTQTTPTVALPTTTTPTGSGFTSADAIIVAAGSLALLGGISFFIWRDARRRAPHHKREVTSSAASSQRGATKRAPKPRKPSPAERRRRKRGKAR
jgi:hypothetical protein